MKTTSLRPWTALVAALLLLFPLAVRAGVTPNPVALVALAKGPVRALALPPSGGPVQQAQVTWIHSLDNLPAGVFLQVGDRATATLAYHADGHREDLTGPCVVRVTPRGSHLVKGDPGAIRIHESEAAEALPPDGPVARAQVAPGTTITVTEQSGMPTFSWTANSSGPYLVTLYAPGTPPTNLWSSECLQGPAGYDGPILTPATPYVVQVESQGRFLGALRFELESDASVRALGAARAEVQAAPQDAAGHAMLAVARDQAGDLSGATQAMQSALDQQPDDTGFLRRMQAMVTEMGDEAAAHQLANRAKMVEDSVDPSLYSDGMNAYMNAIEGIYLP